MEKKWAKIARSFFYAWPVAPFRTGNEREVALIIKISWRYHHTLLDQAGSFDCGSRGRQDEATFTGSPPLRMTDCLENRLRSNHA